MADELHEHEQDYRAGKPQRHARRRPYAGPRDPHPAAHAVRIGDDERECDPDEHLPEVVDHVAIQEVVAFANQEREREPAERKRDWPLRRTVICNPREQQAADTEDERLHDFDRRELARPERIPGVARYV